MDWTEMTEENITSANNIVNGLNATGTTNILGALR